MIVFLLCVVIAILLFGAEWTIGAVAIVGALLVGLLLLAGITNSGQKVQEAGVAYPASAGTVESLKAQEDRSAARQKYVSDSTDRAWKVMSERDERRTKRTIDSLQSGTQQTIDSLRTSVGRFEDSVMHDAMARGDTALANAYLALRKSK